MKDEFKEKYNFVKRLEDSFGSMQVELKTPLTAYKMALTHASKRTKYYLRVLLKLIMAHSWT